MSYSQKCLQGARRGLGTAEKYKSKVLWFYRCVCVYSQREDSGSQKSSSVIPSVVGCKSKYQSADYTHTERERDIQLRVFSSSPEALRGSWPDEVFKLQVLWHSGYFVLITLALPLCCCFGIYFSFNLYSSRSLHSDFQHPVISLLKCQDLSAQKRDYG